jgi:hypothetical protein
MKDGVNQMEKIADILESIDEDTKPADLSAKLKPVMEKMKDLKKRADALGEPSKEIEEKLGKEMMESRKKLMGRVTAALQKLAANPELLKVAQEAMKDM